MDWSSKGAKLTLLFPQLADSPDQPEGEATYKITQGGIEVSTVPLEPSTFAEGKSDLVRSTYRTLKFSCRDYTRFHLVQSGSLSLCSPC